LSQSIFTIGEVIAISILLFISFVVTAFELALFSSSKVRLIYLERKGFRGVRYANKLLKKQTSTINTIIFINVVTNTATSVILAEIFVRNFGDELGGLLAVVVGTILILIFGEAIPKTFGLEYREAVSIKLSPIMYMITRFVEPISNILFSVSGGFVRLLSRALSPREKEISRRDYVSEEEVKIFLRLAEKSGSLSRDERVLIERLMSFMDKRVEDAMIPKKDLVLVSISDKLDNVIELLSKYGHSRYPVYEGEIDNIVGFIHVKDLLSKRENKGEGLKEFVRPIYKIYGDTKLYEALKIMRKTRTHMLIVVDYNNNLLGAVTLEDIMEEIFGEIYDEFD